MSVDQGAEVNDASEFKQTASRSTHEGGRPRSWRISDSGRYEGKTESGSNS